MWIRSAIFLTSAILTLGSLYAYVTPRYTITILRKQEITDFVRRYEVAAPEPSEATGGATVDPMDYRAPHPYTGFKSEPDTRYKTDTVDVQTNHLGHRSPALGMKRNGVVRIAMLGGSVVFAGDTNEDAIVARIARLAEADGLEVESINAGIVSGISNQELAVLVHELLELEVDLVIALDGYNDILHAIAYNGRVGWPPFRWDPIGRESRRLGQLAPSYYPRIKPWFTPSAGVLAAIEANYLRNVEKMALISEAAGIRFLAALQPSRSYAPREEGRNESKWNAFYNDVIKVFARWDDQRLHSGHYLSVADVFDAHREVFTDDAHTTSDGRVILAALLYEELRRRELL